VAAAPLFDELPGDVVLHLLLLVPIDERLALRVICKSWSHWLGRSHSAGCSFSQARAATSSAPPRPRTLPARARSCAADTRSLAAHLRVWR